MNRGRLVVVLALLLGLIACSSGNHAAPPPGPPGKVKGDFIDATGPLAHVPRPGDAELLQNGKIAGIAHDPDGHGFLVDLPSGKYTVGWVGPKGKRCRRDVTVIPNQTTTIHLAC